MRIFIVFLVIFISSSAMAQSDRNSARSSGTHIMGSGAKNVDGMGVNKDTTKYKQLRGLSEEELQKEEVGNNPTSTDTIKGKNSKKIR